MFLLFAFSWLVPVFISLFGLSFAGTLLWHKHKAAIARTASMGKLAEQLGMAFSAKDSFGIARQLQGFDLFKRERSRWLGKGEITNVMRGLKFAY